MDLQVGRRIRWAWARAFGHRELAVLPAIAEGARRRAGGVGGRGHAGTRCDIALQAPTPVRTRLHHTHPSHAAPWTGEGAAAHCCRVASGTFLAFGARTFALAIAIGVICGPSSLVLKIVDDA